MLHYAFTLPAHVKATLASRKWNIGYTIGATCALAVFNAMQPASTAFAWPLVLFPLLLEGLLFGIDARFQEQRDRLERIETALRLFS